MHLEQRLYLPAHVQSVVLVTAAAIVVAVLLIAISVALGLDWSLMRHS